MYSLYIQFSISFFDFSSYFGGGWVSSSEDDAYRPIGFTKDAHGSIGSMLHLLIGTPNSAPHWLIVHNIFLLNFRLDQLFL